MAKLRVIILLITFAVVGFFGYFASLYARGYRFDSDTLKFLPSGIIVVKSEPDGASIYINGDLRGATNTNISLSPGTYDVEIKKEGFISWSKRLTIKQEEVTQITAHLFKSAPSLSPITFTGVSSPAVSSDYSKIAYTVASTKQNTGKEGLWIMQIATLPIGFKNEPKRITDGALTEATYQFSPSGQEILFITSSGTYLLDTGDFTAQKDRVNQASKREEILASWEEEKQKKNQSLLKNLPTEISDILTLKTKSYAFSPDEQMIMYTAQQPATISENLIKQLPGSSTQKQVRDIKEGSTYIYDIKEDRNFLISDNVMIAYWLPTSRHLVIPEYGSVSIIEYDGTNKQVIFSGNYIPPYAYPFVNASKILILTNLGADTQEPNLYTLTIK